MVTFPIINGLHPGGTSLLNTKFSPWPCFSEEEVAAVSRVLSSNKVNYWTGEETRLFEKEFSQFTGTDYAVATANGTLALDLSLIGLGIGAGDEVIVTPRSFIASVSCVVTAGATPVFADVDKSTQALSANTIETALTSKTKAVIVVHLAGLPADMDDIMALSKKHGFVVIEDCAQAHGTVYKGRPVGSIGHVGAWSFCQDKIMTTGGEGGMVTTNDQDLWSSMWSYKDHGKSWKAVYEKEHPPGYRWLHESFGTNWRMLEMQAVIGRIQLGKMPEWKAARNKNASEIWSTCKDLSWIATPTVDDGSEVSAYRAYITIKPEHLPSGWSRDRIIEVITEQGVPVFSGTCSEIYRELAFKGSSFEPQTRLPVARELGERSIMFLVHPTLTQAEIEKTCQAIRTVHNLIEDELISQ